MGDVWDFIQDQILRMEWLDSAVGSLLVALGLDLDEKLGASIQFFIYDFIKIMILLTILIFIISYIQTYFPPERTKRILGRYKGIPANTAGALLGTVTPFCSCSSIPLFIGFTRAGLSLGVAFSFLISSPFVDLAALILLTSIFGIELAVIYVIVGVLLAIIGGTLIDMLHMEDQLMDVARPSDDHVEESTECMCACKRKKTIREGMTRNDRIVYSWIQVKGTVAKVWPYILIGVTVGALIHNWIPEDIIQTILGDENPFSVLLATVVGIPIYADIFGTIPIAEALYDKGVGAGTILAFMMAVTATSIPSLAMLKSACKTRLLALFFAIVLVGIVIIGYLFNFIQPMLGV